MEEFRLPQSQAEAVYKLSENVYEFIGNYLVIGVVCVVCVLCAPAACPHAGRHGCGGGSQSERRLCLGSGIPGVP